MQSSGGASPFVATAGLLLETSLGPLTIDLAGADCPALSANFVNLCRAQFWHGAVATEVIPEVAVFFSLTADPVHHSLLCAALDRHGASGPVQSFWSLLPPSPVTPSTQSAGGQDVVAQQQQALQHAMQLEIRQCKRRRCVGISSPPTSSAGGTATAAADACRPVFAATAAGGPPSPCSVSQSGLLLVDVTAPTLRFGLTLSSRSMDFLEKQYVAVGRVVEGESVLRRMQRAPLRERPADTTVSSSPSSSSQRVAGQEDVVGGRPASAWPLPLRMLRVKRAVVLPTAGTDKYLSLSSSASLSVLGGARSAADALRQRQRVGEALHAAGCFDWWASAAAVRAAQGQVAAVVAASLAAEGRTAQLGRPTTVAEAERLLRGTSANAASLSAPLVILQDSAALLKRQLPEASSEVPAVSYNPHSTGAFLSSGDDDDEVDAAQRERTGQSAKQLEERRRLFMQQHQEKASETLSLMLNLLNGVADTRGDIKPPETVLFVCKLNPVTTGEGLALCFAQFGHVVSADVIADPKTKQSLCYGFVEFESVEACFRAFQKMDRALVDDCRIHVDFSQSVSKLWSQRQREMRKRDRPS